MTKIRKISLIVFSVLLSALLVLSGFMIYKELSDRQKEKEDFNELAELVQMTPPEQPQTKETEPSAGNEPEPAHKRDLSSLFTQNSDCIGWICIPGTEVDYPVMHTPDEPQKYLRLNFYGEYSQSGVPFLDYRCSLASSNLILYGHNMKNGTMFSAVTGYADEEYAKEHPTIEFETEVGCRTYTVFAAVSVKNTDEWYGFIDASDKERFDAAVSDICERARYTTGAVPEYGKQLLTLSTCYGSGKDERLIVMAVNL